MAERVAVVTGATGGLGPAVVARLGANNFEVVGLGSREADLTKAADVGAAFKGIVQQHGRLDALVNVAGGFAGGQPVHETDVETWQRMLDLNLTATFLCCRAAIPHMLAGGFGRIVNISSRTAVQPAAGLSAYGVSKAGVVTLTHTLAAELVGTNVTANAVLPSVVDTAANRAAMPQADHSKWVTPEEIAAVIADLLSDRWGIVSGAAIPAYGRA